MKSLLKYTLFLVLVFSFASLAFAEEEGLKVGDSIEDFTLPDGLGDKDLNFTKDIKGKNKVTAFIFANTSCGACRKEIEALSNLSKEYKDFKTYVVLVDMNGSEMVHTFHERFKFDVTYLLDPEFTIPPVYGFYFTPSLLLVNQDGVIEFKKGGYSMRKDEQTLKDKVGELVAK